MNTWYELICPRCAFRTLAHAIYMTCSRCGCFFYASASGAQPLRTPLELEREEA